ncbi:hypothetical protein H2248_011721 [Termitomyces sp. 'cryptogamus']|nr:hypothetical protein H2248_011721 [Termitomyces sp. 'cryptogamus']
MEHAVPQKRLSSTNHASVSMTRSNSIHKHNADAKLGRGVDHAEIWTDLCKKIEFVMNSSTVLASQDYRDYIALYTMVYNYMTSSKSYRPDDCRLEQKCPKLYFKVLDCLVEYLNLIVDEFERLQDIELLRYYATQWDYYTARANFLSHVLAHFDQYWIQRERKEGRMTIYPIYTLALVQWKDMILSKAQKEDQKLTTAILHFITRKEKPTSIDQDLVKTVINSFISLGINGTDPHKECLDVYDVHFEKPFLQATRHYFPDKLKFSSGNISEYISELERHLREKDRVSRYVHDKTHKTLMTTCDDVRPYFVALWDAFQKCLDHDQEEDMQLIYAVLVRFSEGVEGMCKKFECHIKTVGLVTVSDLIKAGEHDADNVDPTAYVNVLSEIHHRFSNMITRTFKGAAVFTASLDRAYRELVNCNAVTGSSTIKSQELLSQCADILLRKDNKITEDALETKLNNIMTLFRYLEEKDVYQTSHARKLSSRLIHHVSASDEREASMISKLREACGLVYVHNLQRMLIDMSISKDITDLFKKLMAQDHGKTTFGFSVLILGAQTWLLKSAPHDFTIPIEIVPVYERFRDFYQTEYPGRKLICLWKYSKTELRTTYLDRNCILMTNSYQMAVLLQYNKNDTMSFDELWTATSISKDVLSQVLTSLVKAETLITEENDHYDLNRNFKSQKTRVHLSLPIEADVETESIKMANEGRKYVLQTTIVRLMKTRKTMKKQTLVQEIVSQVFELNLFTPQISDVNKTIELLLEKEYIEHVDGSKDILTYIA